MAARKRSTPLVLKLDCHPRTILADAIDEALRLTALLSVSSCFVFREVKFVCHPGNAKYDVMGRLKDVQINKLIRNGSVD